LKIALDVDGVLADVIHTWLSYNNKIRTTISKSDISEWDFWKRYNINKFDFYAELSMCWKSWKTIPPTESDISYASKELSRVGTVDIVTAREDSTHEDVRNWLKMHNVTYKTYVGVKEGTEKTKLDYDVFIDDSPINAQHLLAIGKPVIIYDQPWNLGFHDTRAKRINELKNAVTIIKETISRD